MKTPRVVNAVEYIDDDLVIAASEGKKTIKHNRWLKWGSIAACFVLFVMAAIGITPNMLSGEDPLPQHMLNEDTPISQIEPITSNTPETEGASGENTGGEKALEKYYSYSIDEGEFSAYIGGKVIAEEKVGNKILGVAVTAGWKNSSDEWIFTENLNAEVYVLDGISEDVAVALKFIDQGEAITTTHYYVIMNPDADLTAVEDYVIAHITSTDNAGDEVAHEGGSASEGDGTVTVTTSTALDSEILE